MKQAFNAEVCDTITALLTAQHDTPPDVEAVKCPWVIDLYRTPADSLLKYETTASLCVEEEDHEIIPISPDEARSLYEEFDDQPLIYGGRFPHV